MSDKETYYDEEIAPALLELANKCKEAGLSFVAVVEYAPDELARTRMLQQDAGLKITMVEHCAHTAPNMDGYVMGLARYCNENGIDTSGSMVMQQLSSSG